LVATSARSASARNGSELVVVDELGGDRPQARFHDRSVIRIGAARLVDLTLLEGSTDDLVGDRHQDLPLLPTRLDGLVTFERMSTLRVLRGLL
jgi:hypothetical protein